MGMLIAPLVLLLERLVGYPDALFRRIGAVMAPGQAPPVKK